MEDLKVRFHLYPIWFYYNTLFYKDKGKLVCFSRVYKDYGVFIKNKKC